MSQITFGRTFLFSICGLLTTLILSTGVSAQQPGAQDRGRQDRAKPQDTEVWEPEPKVVIPGSADSAPPSDAIVLFDGNNLDQWVNTSDKSPANWIVNNGVMTVSKAKGGGQYRNQTHIPQLPAAHRMEDSREYHRNRPVAWQQRGLSGFHRPCRCRVRVADSRFVSQ